MKRLALVFLVACGDDGSGPGNPHAIVQCGASWDSDDPNVLPPDSCEFACEETPPNYAGSGSDMPCLANHPEIDGGNFMYTCPRTFDWNGQRGCCLVERASLDEYRARLWTCID